MNRIILKLLKKYGWNQWILRRISIGEDQKKRASDLSVLYDFSPDVKASALREKTWIYEEEPGIALSVIVPVYQTESFVRPCLESLLNQKTRYSYRIILVNDGTRDQSIERIRDLLNDSRILLLEQDNQGLSSARNTGLSAVNSPYVTFVDSDDYVSDQMIELWMNKAVETDADIVVGNFSYFYERSGKLKENRLKEGNKYAYSGTACIKLFKTELFRQILFPKGYWFEDSIVKHLLFSLTDRIQCVAEPVYFYRIHASGITVESRISPKCVDSTYITVQMLKDREVLGIKNTPEYFSYFLRQLIMNDQREQRIPSNIRYEIFCWMAELTEQYFPGFGNDLDEPYLQLLHQALLYRDFKAYSKICMFS